MIYYDKVTKIYPDKSVALENVSFGVEPKEFVTIVGHSGAGKTTLMKMLIAEDYPTDGAIFFESTDISKLSKRNMSKLRRRIGTVFQDYRLLSEFNVWENIALPLSILGKAETEIESRVTDLLSLVSLSERALAFPKQLSGGEAQRVSIARALAMGPSVIFADEPTGNLDKKASLSIVKLLQQINSLGTTVILATHDVTLLEYLENERQLDLDHGKLVHDSRPSPMKATVKVEKAETEEEPVKTVVEELDEEEELKKTAKPRLEPEKVEAETPAKKSAKKKPAKKAKTLKTKIVEGDELISEFEPVETKKEPPIQKTSWLKKLGGGLPSIKLPSLGKKPMKPEKKDEETA